MAYLTKKQKEIFNFIKSFIEKYNYAPSYREIAEGLGKKSPATVWQHVEMLQKKGYLRKISQTARSLELPSYQEEIDGIPVLGTIAGGEPIEAIRTSETIQIPKDMIQKGVFALKVKGNSMAGEGIYDGDYVIIQPSNVARNGDIVVALIEDDKATLKKYYKEKDYVRLEPANGKMKPIKTKQIIIQGKVKGIIRKFK